MNISNKLFGVLKHSTLIIYAFFALFPLVWMLLLSIKSDTEMFTTTFVFTPTLENYKLLLFHEKYLSYFMDNLIVSVGAVLVSVIVGVPAAYALARYDFKGRDSLAFTFLSFRFAPEILVILPLFLIYQKLHLIDTYVGLIWVYQLISLPLLIWILRGYFEDISSEIEYAAQLDGYSWWQVFIKVLVPLIKPGLVASALLCFIFVWNSFTFPFLLAGQKVITTSVVTLNYLSAGGTVHFGRMASAVAVSILPEILLTILIQKHLVRGLSMGAVKG